MTVHLFGHSFFIVTFHLGGGKVRDICITSFQSAITLAEAKGILTLPPLSLLDFPHWHHLSVWNHIPSAWFSSKHGNYWCAINCYSWWDETEANMIESIVAGGWRLPFHLIKRGKYDFNTSLETLMKPLAFIFFSIPRTLSAVNRRWEENCHGTTRHTPNQGFICPGRRYACLCYLWSVGSRVPRDQSLQVP